MMSNSITAVQLELAYGQTVRVEWQTGGCLLTFSRGTWGTRLRVAGSGRYGRMRGLHLPARLGVPHPPLRGTFSRGA